MEITILCSLCEWCVSQSESEITQLLPLLTTHQWEAHRYRRPPGVPVLYDEQKETNDV